MLQHVATIVPTKLLHLIKNDEYHMSLAQLIGADEAYTKFYQERVAEGKFVLMDNGAAEGEQPTALQLVPKIELLKPTEVILPDTIYDMDSTLDKGLTAIEEFNRTFGNDCPDFMAVPQGDTFIDWLACAKEMLDWPIRSIGVSKFITNRYGEEARFLAVQALRAMEAEFGKEPKEIHLLGCWATPREIGEIQEQFDIRGCDSAIAYVYTRAGLVFYDSIPRPHGEIDFINGTVNDIDLMQCNADRWRKYCNGGL